MDRICPTCKENLGTIGDYFCYKCGVKLPVHLTTDEVRMRSGSALIPPAFVVKEELAKNYSKSLLGIFLFSLSLVIVALVAFLLVKYYLNSKNKVLIKPSEVSDNRLIKFDVDLPTITFGSEGFATLVPSDSDFYVEGSSLTKLLSAFTKIASSTPLPGSNFKVLDIDNLVEGPYAIFSKNKKITDTENVRVWGLISKAKNTEMLKGLVDSTKEATWSARLFDDYVVVSNDKDMFNEVERAKNKVTLNLSLNSRYASSKNSLPANGKLFILLFTNSSQDSLKSFKGNSQLNEKFTELMDILSKVNKNSYVVQ